MHIGSTSTNTPVWFPRTDGVYSSATVASGVAPRSQVALDEAEIFTLRVLGHAREPDHFCCSCGVRDEEEPFGEHGKRILDEAERELP